MSKSPFQLTQKEKVLLQKHYEFYRALETGTHRPVTEAQAHFVAVCRGHAKARTEHEIAYAKYLRIRAVREQGKREMAKARASVPMHDEEYPELSRAA
jgi:uncharacterized protein YifE (UPF0438 family)